MISNNPIACITLCVLSLKIPGTWYIYYAGGNSCVALFQRAAFTAINYGLLYMGYSVEIEEFGWAHACFQQSTVCTYVSPSAGLVLPLVRSGACVRGGWVGGCGCITFLPRYVPPKKDTRAWIRFFRSGIN